MRQRRGGQTSNEATSTPTRKVRASGAPARHVVAIIAVLVATALAAPTAIRHDVERVTRRLAYEPLESVLPDLSGALAHSIGDLVVASILLASQTGGRHLASQLASLADAAHADAAMHRRVEVARQQPRSTMRTVAMLIVGFTGLMFIVADDWMRAYDRPAGQVVLVMVALLMAAGLVWMSRMGRIPSPERFYIAATSRTPPTGGSA